MNRYMSIMEATSWEREIENRSDLNIEQIRGIILQIETEEKNKELMSGKTNPDMLGSVKRGVEKMIYSPDEAKEAEETEQEAEVAEGEVADTTEEALPEIMPEEGEASEEPPIGDADPFTDIAADTEDEEETSLDSPEEVPNEESDEIDELLDDLGDVEEKEPEINED